MATIEQIVSKLQRVPPELLLDVDRFVEAMLQRQAPLAAHQIVAEAPEQCVFHCAEEMRAYQESERRAQSE